MNWITIDEETCTVCGLCVTRCRNYREEDGAVTGSADAETCNLCGHCVALCPTDAITHSQMDMGNFLEVPRDLKVETKEFFDLVRARRSQRLFNAKKIPQQDLEELVELCRYIPTGSNRQTLEIVVLQDEGKIKKLSDLTADFLLRSGREVIQTIEELEKQGKEVPEALRFQQSRVGMMQRLEQAREMGLDPILYQAPAVMIFHGPKVGSTPKDDCVIAAQTVVLAAMTMGLGTCYIGLVEGASRADPAINEELKLPPDHRIGSVLVLGYPKLKFLRTVDRFPMKVRWE